MGCRDSVPGRVRAASPVARGIVACACFALAAALSATTLLPLPDDDLRARSTVIVEGFVERVEPFASSRGFPETQTTIRLIQLYKGRLSGPLVLRDRGGMLPNGRWLKIYGRPDYVVGRRVLVFAIPHPDGEFQTAEFTLGKFEVWRDAAGRRFLARDLLTRSREGIEYVAAGLEPAEDTLRDHVAFVRMLRFPRRGSAGPTAAPRPTGTLAPEEDSSSAGGVRPLWADWGGPRYRWANGASVSWTLSATANLIIGGGYAEARAAIASWSNHANSSINYSDGGIAPSGANFLNLASVSVCGSNGPLCGGGVLGCGGPGGITGSHTWRGESYGTITWAHVEIRQSTGPSCISSGSFAAAVTHELGHTLGFGHSDQGASAHDTCRGDESLAQMRSFVQSRGTSLGTDDSDAARWVYGDGLNSCSPPPPPPTPTRTPTLIPPTATRTPTSVPPTATRIPTSAFPTATRTPTISLPTPTRTPTRTPSPVPPTPTPGGPGPTAPAPPPTSTRTPPPPTRTPTRPPSTATPTPPPPPSETLRANFAWSPANPRPGDAVQFTDLSEGSPDRWSWTFGSGSGDEGTSTLQNPRWVFTRENIFTVSLTVRSADRRSTRRRKVTVSASSTFSSAPTSGIRTVPIAGHVLGADGRTFVTDVQIENPGDAAATAALTFQPASGEAPATVPLELGARETRNLNDAVLDLFGLSDAIGALRLQWHDGSRDGLRMTSRTYTRDGEGTLGQAVGGAARSEDQWTSRFVTGLARTDLYRTNLGAVNDSAEFQSFRVALRNRRGETLGESSVIGLAPGRQTQLALAELFPPAWGKGFTAEFRPVGGSAAPFAYAVVVDNLSGDSAFYPAAPAASALCLPGVARITGYDGTFFSSDLAVANTGDAAAEIEVRFLEHDRDNSESAPVRLILGPRESLQVDDVLGVLFHASETYGALAIESDSAKLAVAERIGTPSATGPGTVGQQVDAIPDHGFFSRGSLLGLREDALFRSNVGVFNPEPFPARVELVLRRADGSPIGWTAYAVPPLGYVQRNVRALFPEAELRAGEALTLSVESGDIDVFAFAAVIDNASQDPTFSPGLR